MLDDPNQTKQILRSKSDLKASETANVTGNATFVARIIIFSCSRTGLT